MHHTGGMQRVRPLGRRTHQNRRRTAGCLLCQLLHCQRQRSGSQFGDPMDKTACEILSAQFPNRTIVPIAAREILLGGGNIHCITQQIPLGRSSIYA